MLEEKCEVLQLQVPVSRDDDDIDFFVEELYQMIESLEKLTGKEITYADLYNGMNIVAGAQYELSRFIELKKKAPYLIRGTHSMAIMNAASYMGAQSWTKYMSKLNRRLEHKANKGIRFTNKELPGILITGSPIIFPNIKIPLLIEELGGYVAADETCMGERGLYDPAVITDNSYDGLLRALANRSIRPCSCPSFADNTERIYRIKQMIKDYKIEGIVYHVLRGCLVYDYEYERIEEEMEKLGIPVIRLESDYNEEDVEQLKILVEELCGNNNIGINDISYIMATGYSRKVLDVADDDISEITAHAYGVRVTAPKEYKPGMIVDIGGQDSKIIYLDNNYAVKNFTMNDKCAAGTGKFMEVIAQILETTINEVGPLSLESTMPCDINSTCVVFAQSEIISLVARKFDRRDILAGMHLSMVKRIIKMMKKSEKQEDVLMTGGGALNIGLHKAFEEELMKDVYVASYPQFNGAIGAALIANGRRR